MVLKAVAGVPQCFTWRSCRLDGAPFEIEGELECLRNSRRIAGQWRLFRDITERTTAAEAPERGRASLSVLLRFEPGSVVLMDLEGESWTPTRPSGP